MTSDQILALIAHQTYNYRASSAVVSELLAFYARAFNKSIYELRDLLDELTESEKTAFASGLYSTDTLKEVRSVFDGMAATLNVDLPNEFMLAALPYAMHEVSFMNRLYGGDAKVTESTIKSAVKKTPLIGGDLFSEVWSQLSASVRRKALNVVRNGISKGDTNDKIMRDLRGKRVKVNGQYKYVGGVLDYAEREITAAVRTVRSHVNQVAYEQTYNALGFEYVRFMAVLDGRTTKGCANYDGTVWQKDSDKIVRPPRHYNCRSVLVGVNKDGSIDGKRPFVEADKPVKDIPKDERTGIIGRVDADVDFKQWFNTTDDKFQRDWLGKTRYELFKQGKYTIDRFVSPDGGEYTIQELRELDEALFRRLGI